MSKGVVELFPTIGMCRCQRLLGIPFVSLQRSTREAQYVIRLMGGKKQTQQDTMFLFLGNAYPVLFFCALLAVHVPDTTPNNFELSGSSHSPLSCFSTRLADALR